MRTRKNRRFTQEIVALAAVLATASAAADVVYDAGAALRENCRSGVHANPYTDVNGGKWSWLWRANVTDVGAPSTTFRDNAAFPGVGAEASPWIRVNASGVEQGAGLDSVSKAIDIYDVVPGLSQTDPIVEQMVEPGELVFHPRAYKNAGTKRLYAAVRFTVPEDGWYEADVAVRDLVRQVALCETNASGAVEKMLIGDFSGAQVTMLANGVQLFQQIVSLEDYATNTSYTANGCVRSYSYHMPATKFLKGQTIDLVVGNKDDSSVADAIKEIANYGDSTGVKMRVTRRDRLVYDGGEALRRNCNSGAYAGVDGSAYTDELGGQWKYLRASNASLASTAAFGQSYVSGSRAGMGGGSSPWLQVNAGDSAASLTSGEKAVEPGELYIHPGNPNNANSHVALQFIVPESGWYSAFMSARDVNKQDNGQYNRITNTSGAAVSMVLNGSILAKGVVSLEDYSGSDADPLLTHRFDFQMPVRYLAAGDTLSFVVGANGTSGSSHQGDATAMKAYVVREKEGMFCDSGIAMKSNVSGPYENPYGTVEEGTWYCLKCEVPYFTPGVPYGMNDELWAMWSPTGLVRSASLLADKAAPASFGGQRGFASSSAGKSPFAYVNESSAMLTNVAPGELYMHPGIARPVTGDRSTWTNLCSVLRFRPSEGGWYSGSVVVRDVANGRNTSADGVVVALNVGNEPVTNALVELEAFTSTAHFTFDARLLAAGEPVDVVVYARDADDSDGTAVSAIIRREQDVRDAGKSFYDNYTAQGKTGEKPFEDVLGGVVWDVGSVSYATNPASFATLPYSTHTVSGGALRWKGYTSSTSGNGGLPRVMVATNGVAGTDGNFVTDALFGTIPREMWAHPNSGSAANRSASVRATVPADGIYTVRGYGRDLVKGADSSAKDGVRVSVGVDGCVPAKVELGREDGSKPCESSFEAGRLWLRSGAAVDVVVECRSQNDSDGTGLSACLVNEGATPGEELSVVNVDFTGAGSGSLSGFNMRGREGWAEWRTWNAVRLDGASSVAKRAKCEEANGSVMRNMTVAISRRSGDNPLLGTASMGNALQNSYVKSTDASDIYDFTISSLKANEPYVLYLYSAYGDGDGKAAFTVGGVSKSPDSTWFSGYGANDVARFDVTSGADGRISGTFRAVDGTRFGAFNGLTLVGALDPYRTSGLRIFFQ